MTKYHWLVGASFLCVTVSLPSQATEKLPPQDSRTVSNMATSENLTTQGGSDSFASGAVGVTAQATVCGQAEYAALLRKSPPSADWLHYPIPPGARIDIQQTLREGWPRRSFLQTLVYSFSPGTKIADVERFFLQAGVYKASGTVYRDVNPNRKPGDSMRKVTEDDGVVTFTIFRRTVPSEGTPFGDIAWTARQLRDHAPTATDLTVPLYPGAVLDIDGSTAMIMTNPSPYLYYSTPDSLQAVKAFYGIPAGDFTRQFSPDDSITVEANRAGAQRNWTRIQIRLSYKHVAGAGPDFQAPTAHLTGPGPAVPGPPPGWQPRRWKDGCERGPIAPIIGTSR